MHTSNRGTVNAAKRSDIVTHPPTQRYGSPSSSTLLLEYSLPQGVTGIIEHDHRRGDDEFVQLRSITYWGGGELDEHVPFWSNTVCNWSRVVWFASSVVWNWIPQVAWNWTL